MAAFDAICSAQKDRRLGASHLTLPYPILPYLRKVRTSVQFGLGSVLVRVRPRRDESVTKEGGPRRAAGWRAHGGAP